MLITCCLLAADGVLQISGKRKLTSGKMEDKENGKTPAQLKDELSGLKMRALQQKAEEVGVAQDLIDEADDSKEDLIDLILAVACKENGKKEIVSIFVPGARHGDFSHVGFEQGRGGGIFVWVIP